MIEMIKKVATLFMTIGLISMSCAATHGSPGVQLLGGNPRVETIGLTIGMTVEDLDEELGVPNGSDVCSLPFEARGQEAIAQGKAFLWNHETSNIPEQTARMSKIMVCVMDGTVVAEHREWMLRNGSVISIGQSDTMDPPLVQSIMDSLLKSDPAGIRIPSVGNKGFEI